MTDKKYLLTTHYKKLLADTHTPVSIYLKLRDKFANTILLESSDYRGNENSYSYICFQSIARFEVKDNVITTQYPDLSKHKTEIKDQQKDVINQLEIFLQAFDTQKPDLDFIPSGLFGYTTFDAVRYFEEIEIKSYESTLRKIPDILYQVYQYIIAINHFKNEMYLVENVFGEKPAGFEQLDNYIQNKNFPNYHFNTVGKEESSLQDQEYMDLVSKGKEHCQQGDVFQVVFSRPFWQGFQGDDFNVYRALRSINPSPYLFYFDYGSFKIFGSSPEAQLVIKSNKASIHPIAGTFKRTGDDKADAEAAQALAEDEKENAEHVMLVDLARNDLSRSGAKVEVETFKEIQFYSHLIHLVSKVSAHLDDQSNSLHLFADTFPAGTLSGAPKYKALSLIEDYEKQNRGFYGGAIGLMGFDGSLNHAIMIRSFLSQNNHLYFQAGAGIVAKSIPENELEEVNNKLRALRNAIVLAQNL